MREAVQRCSLDLGGTAVLTEAATGAYAVTAPIAALAGAQVTALARDSRYGSARDAEYAVMELASAAGVAERVRIVQAVPQDLSGYGIVTNSGHLRPIDAAMITRLPGNAVIALMFEAWELREGDIDIDACRARGIRIAAVNERHAAVDVFSYLGPLSLHALQDAGVACYGGRVALLCDNAFGPYILRSLSNNGVEAAVFTEVTAMPQSAWDAVLVALHPHAKPRIDAAAAARLASVAADAAIVQIWGDIDRTALAAHGFEAWPPQAPRTGHMAVLMSDIGPEAVVRLQAGGLAAASRVWRGDPVTPDGIAELV
ncbi:hypothetical protein [Reyranella sp.]|uniref:hypothetical protein n=1 Tax=Reyranella sp. TaxID=1929291 RepID=UPI003D0AB5DB